MRMDMADQPWERGPDPHPPEPHMQALLASFYRVVTDCETKLAYLRLWSR